MNILCTTYCTLFCVALIYWILCCAVLDGTLYKVYLMFSSWKFSFSVSFFGFEYLITIWICFATFTEKCLVHWWVLHTHTPDTQETWREKEREKKMWYSGLRNLFIVLASMHCCWCICVAYEHKWSVRVLRWWFNELCTLKSVFIFFFQNRLSLSSHQPFCFINCFLIFSFFYSHSKSL